MNKIKLVYRAIPERVMGLTMRRGEEYLMIIDESLSPLERKETIKHELSHVLLGHFNDGRAMDDQAYLNNIDEIEKEADEYAEQMTDEEYDQLIRLMVRTAV